MYVPVYVYVHMYSSCMHYVRQLSGGYPDSDDEDQFIGEEAAKRVREETLRRDGGDSGWLE